MYQVAIKGGVMGTVIAGPVLALSADSPSCSPVTDVPNSNVSGGTEWIFASVQGNGVSSGCLGGACIFNFKDLPWQPLTTYALGQEIVDSNYHIEVVETAGTSAGTVPFWPTTPGNTVSDGTVKWLDQGQPTAVTPPGWVSGPVTRVGSLILDSNNNIERCNATGHVGRKCAHVEHSAGWHDDRRRNNLDEPRFNRHCRAIRSRRHERNYHRQYGRLRNPGRNFSSILFHS